MDQIHNSFVRRLTELAVAGYNVLKGEPTGGTVEQAFERLSKLANLITPAGKAPEPESTQGIRDKAASLAAAVAGGIGVEEMVRAVKGTAKSATDAAASAVGGALPLNAFLVRPR